MRDRRIALWTNLARNPSRRAERTYTEGADDAGTGQLFYDADGNGAGAAILFAQVVPGTAITTASFDVIAPPATNA